MSILKGKHIEKEINGIRCRVVESGISKSRADFLEKLLVHNGLEVHVEQEPVKPPPKPKPTAAGEEPPTVEEPLPEPDPTYVIGVTNIIFNATVAVYNRQLRTFEGKRVTPDYWNQKTENTEPNYWDRSKKEWL